MTVKFFRASILGTAALALICTGSMNAAATPPDDGPGRSMVDRSDDIGSDGLTRRGKLCRSYRFGIPTN